MRLTPPSFSIGLTGLSLVLLLLWYFPTGNGFTPDETALWQRVREAQHELVQYRLKTGTASDPEIDPWGSGLMGIEWSPITTTEGDIHAKRTAAHPVWAVQFQRWFRELGLEPGDRIAVYSSSSFPGMLLNALMAAESLDLEVHLGISLGASTWGGNHPEFSLPVIHGLLKELNYLKTDIDFFTLGGNGEMGRGMPKGGKEILRRAALGSNAPLLTAESLEEMVAAKSDLLASSDARVLVNIGGSHANLGNDEGILDLPPGLLRQPAPEKRGNGVVGLALCRRMPVIHILNLRGLCQKLGLPYDRAPEEGNFQAVGRLSSLLGLAVFCSVMARHRRWYLVDPS